jgi:hypothetical protein
MISPKPKVTCKSHPPTKETKKDILPLIYLHIWPPHQLTRVQKPKRKGHNAKDKIKINTRSHTDAHAHIHKEIQRRV